MAGALIVTAELGPPDLAWLDGLRRHHYPVERNQLPAHLTMFHALPPSLEEEARRRLALAAKARGPQATVAGIMDLGGGVALRIVSEDLDRIREDLSAGFHGMLGAQDQGGWRPHVTIQNKVSNREARQLVDTLEAGFVPRRIAIHGLGLHRYLGGPWETLQVWPFRGAS
jgi:hypothetical protein